MSQRDPVLVVMRPTRIQRPDGRIITLKPGCKSDAVSEAIKSAVPREKLDELKKGDRVREETPPWD